MTYPVRSASSKAWNSPLSRIVSKDSLSVSRRSASSTWKMASIPRSAALRRAISIARGDIDAQGVGTPARCQDRVLTGPAARVEQGTGERASVGETEKCGLWAPDVPGWRQVLIKVVPVVG